MKKTILEWYDHLPEPIRSEAIKNYNGTEGLYDTLAGAIDCGTTWSKTPQGYCYWESIWGRAENGEFDTPIESDLVKAARKVVDSYREVTDLVKEDKPSWTELKKANDRMEIYIYELEKLLK